MIYIEYGPFPGCQWPGLIIPFLVGNAYKPLFATGILGRGHIQDIQSFPYLIFLTRYVAPQELKA